MRLLFKNPTSNNIQQHHQHMLFKLVLPTQPTSNNTTNTQQHLLLKTTSVGSILCCFPQHMLVLPT